MKGARQLPNGAKVLIAAVAAVAAALTTSPSTACPLPPPALQQAAVQLAWQLHTPTIKVGRHFALDIQLCPAGAALLRVDAQMPEHRHGMNYRPSLKQLAPGQWRAEGLLFHMPGRWELVFDVQAAPNADGPAPTRFTLRESLVLP